MSNFYLKVGNTKPSISAALTINGTPIGSLVGASVKFRMRDINGPAGVYKVDADAVIVDPVTCAVRYDWIPANVNTAGIFVADWHVIYGDLSDQTVPNASSQFVFISAGL